MNTGKTAVTGARTVGREITETQFADMKRDILSEARGVATGDRIKLSVDIERYPHFVARKGLTGVVVETHASDWPKSIAVKLDEPLNGCEEWDNHIIWQEEEMEYFQLQVEKA